VHLNNKEKNNQRATATFSGEKDIAIPIKKPTGGNAGRLSAFYCVKILY